MIEIWKTSVGLFLRGKLFADPAAVFRRSAAGAGATAALCVILGLVLPLWLAAAISGLVGGFLQPVLFKNLKYA